MKSPKILFLSNRRSLPGTDTNYPYNTLESGLVNSIRFIIELLTQNCYNAEYVQVEDANKIDSVVFAKKPDVVIVEAIWVSPSKFKELVSLHPNVKWIVRIHSEMGFLANEGIAMEWISEYSKIKNVSLAANSDRMVKQLKVLSLDCPVYYLPNWYGGEIFENNKKAFEDNVLNISCWGALRPMKGQLQQAVSAIDFARIKNKLLKFHINIGREEMGGNSVLKNLRALFKNKENCELVEHKWSTHKEFIEIVKQMDVSMQVSYSETFNIVSADSVTCMVPIVVSPEISWLPKGVMADPNNGDEIVSKLLEIEKRAKKNGNMVKENLKYLRKYNEHSEKEWKKFVEVI